LTYAIAVIYTISKGGTALECLVLAGIPTGEMNLKIIWCQKQDMLK